jgi:bifunctional DNA-binding transcriptional regulator/antitoxin component of YhaV-PrlF toxin-antitoxin module
MIVSAKFTKLRKPIPSLRRMRRFVQRPYDTSESGMRVRESDAAGSITLNIDNLAARCAQLGRILLRRFHACLNRSMERGPPMPVNVVAVRKWGNSRGVVIPRHIQRQLKWRIGDVLCVSCEDNRVVFRPIQLPVEVRPHGDGATDSESAGRGQQHPGAENARRAPDESHGRSASDGERDSTLV